MRTFRRIGSVWSFVFSSLLVAATVGQATAQPASSPATQPAAPAGGALAGEAPALSVLRPPDFTGRVAHRVVRVPSPSVILVEMGKQSVPVRLLGIEPDPPGVPAATFASRAAINFLRNLLIGEHVYIVRDEAEAGSPTTTYIYRAPDGLFVNAELIRQGYARVHTKPRFQHRETFLDYEKHAYRYGKGLWGRLARQAAQQAAQQAASTPPAAKPQPIAPRPTRPSAPQATPAQPRPPIQLVGNRQSYIYHDTTCRLCRRIVFPETIKSPRDAQLKSYRPCRVCKPPK